MNLASVARTPKRSDNQGYLLRNYQMGALWLFQPVNPGSDVSVLSKLVTHDCDSRVHLFRGHVSNLDSIPEGLL